MPLLAIRAGRRSVFEAALCHAAYNTAWQLMPDPVRGYSPWVVAGLTWVVVGVIVIIGGTGLVRRHPTRASSGRRERYPEVRVRAPLMRNTLI